MAFDWAIWAANFPVSWRHEEAMPQAGLPERIVISRAGKDLTLTLKEFAEISRGLTETLANPAGSAQHAIAKE